MGRKSKKDYPSTGSMAASFLSVVVVIVLGAGIVILKAKRRAANDPNRISRTDDGGGGGFTPDPQPFNPNPQPNNPFPNNPNPQPPQPKRPKPGVRQSDPAGGAFGANDYREYREDGALLVGFELGLGKAGETDVISYMRPIWLTPSGEKFGTAYGFTDKPVVTVKARDGYVVGGAHIAGGGAMEGIALTFMKRGAKGLVVEDAYVSDWYGEQTRKPRPEDMKRGEGEFIIGIYGKRFDSKGGKRFDQSGAIANLGFYLWVPE